MTNVHIIFHSIYGDIYRLAQAAADGAREAGDVAVRICQVPELLSEEQLQEMGGLETKKSFAHIPVATMQDLTEADAILFGAPTYFGKMSSQMSAFLDSTAYLWVDRALVGKVGGAFTSTECQNGGQEATLLGFCAAMLHHGMIIAGVPYTVEGLSYKEGISGGSPYGASTIASEARQPNANELAIARGQGHHVAEIAKRLR